MTIIVMPNFSSAQTKVIKIK